MNIVQKLKIYRKIIEIVKSPSVYSKKTKEKIIEKIESDLDLKDSISDRTFQRLLQNLRNEFHIDITYNSRLADGIGGYEINIEGDNKEVEEINFFDELSTSLKTFTNLKELKTNSEFIQISSESSAISTDQFTHVLDALKQKKKLCFTYKKPGYELKEYLVSPLLLKEYDTKWYLVCTHHNEFEDEIKVFGLKRLVDIEVLKESSNDGKKGQAVDQLNNALGVSNLNKSPEHIVIATTKKQSIFLDQSPIHFSQEKIKEGSNVAVYKYYMIINIDLKMRILSYGSTMRVIGPSSFKKWYQNTINIMSRSANLEEIDLDNAQYMFE